MKTLPKRVNFATDLDCIEAAVLGLMGLSTKLIMERTGLTQCQVTYRLGKAEIKRAEYRNGESASFKTVFNLAHGKLTRDVTGTLGKRIKG